jgi:ATP phosphoribosyltransferase regulatory subunit
MTPQIARIDAHRINAQTPTRLCYNGPILHTMPDKFAGSRNPLQLGAELYGHAGIESDAEVIALMVEVLAAAGVGEVTLDLGHMGIFHGLAEAAALDAAGEERLLDVLLRKAACELPEVLAKVQGPAAAWLSALLSLNGDAGVLERAKLALAGAPDAVRRALDDLDALVALLVQRCPSLDVHVDLADLRGYRYHTGVMFAAYTRRMGRPIAWGGRYDNIGARYGRARAATGFSTDLKLLAALSAESPVGASAILAPAGVAADLLSAIAALRASGQQVIQALPGQTGGAREMGCARELALVDGRWVVAPSL